jgi:hypothetical protein
MKRPSYHEACFWIAMNDNAGNDDSLQEVTDYITVAMLADIWGLETEKVGRDVWGTRKRIEAAEATAATQ